MDFTVSVWFKRAARPSAALALRDCNESSISAEDSSENSTAPAGQVLQQSEMCLPSSRCTGLTLIPISCICIISNLLLLFPDTKFQYLRERHVTPEAVWCTGIWGSGVLVLVAARGFVTQQQKKGCCFFTAEVLRKVGYTCLAVLAAGLCFVLSGTGLALGPFCLHNETNGLNWGRPLKQMRSGEKLYLFEPERWASACVEPKGVLIWNMVLFGLLMGASGLQLLLCFLHLLRTSLELFCSPFHYCRKALS
ncbi:hypothetical protein DNTS_022716 [Danionella cerebrum]|uniref:Uncharacterized protein n=1 Tax=Danionella cerebrum TaxID=2873325 RepID=A0A553MY65_9TELE|nr:hypothetical protein DNTS_022716 [Danionella translucida]